VHPRLELVIYRVLQECFTNISQHSAASHINVSLTSTDGEVRLSVEDDGVGFNVTEGLGRRNCYGLAGMRERVRLLGGRFSIESTPDRGSTQYHSRGTKVMIQLPVTGENPGPI
jgi:signal transduction histidine kinase